MNFSQVNKIAFIGNLAFFVTLIMRFYPFLQGSQVESLVLITGLIISPLLNLVVFALFLWRFTRADRSNIGFVQAFNAFSACCQIILFLFFSGWLPLSNINT